MPHGFRLIEGGPVRTGATADTLDLLKSDIQRRVVLETAFCMNEAIWLSHRDLRLLGLTDIELRPGERMHSVTGEIFYSAAWL